MAQALVDLRRVLGQRGGKALREVHLKDIPRGDVIDGALDGGDIAVTGEVGIERAALARLVGAAGPG